ncbi:ribose ABC transporter ATP-binding protein RbsA [soil metagenome]
MTTPLHHDTNAPLLQMTAIRKEFPGVVALDGVEFSLLPGEVHAIVGENGAGKSTLIKIIAGLYRHDSGEMRIDGQPVVFRNPADSIHRGIKVVYQELDLVPEMSVAENVFLGTLPKSRFGIVDWQALTAKTLDILDELGLDIDPSKPVGELRVAEQQLVEIARALSLNARIVIMDEPTSALSPGEVSKLFEVIEQMRQHQVGIIYVSHKLDEIFRIANRVTVFRDGKRVSTASTEETNPTELVEWMVGRELSELYPKSPAAIHGPLLVAEDVSGPGIRGISLTVHAGEVVGVFGLMGAGINSVGRLLFGASARTGGTVVLDGETIKSGSPADAMNKGLALLTESRKEDGLVLPLSVKENITLASLKRFSTFTWLNPRKETLEASNFVSRLAIKTPSLRQKVQFLSGGNQQKVLMARWLMRDPKVLVLTEPTRGIDVGSKAEIYRLIDEMAHRDLGILFMSTEIPEILGISDRILVMREGEIVAEFSRAEATQELLIEAAAVTRRSSDLEAVA